MNTKSSDILAVISKGVVGAIPIVGPLAAEVIGTIIPDQRIDRIEKLLKELDKKLKRCDSNTIHKQFTTPETVDLLEDSFYQAARAMSDSRISDIASLIKNSLTDEQLKHIEYKKMLSILGELNDIEILLLKSYTLMRGTKEHNNFWTQHEETLKRPGVVMSSSQEKIDRAAIFNTYKEHLNNLGLLKQKFKKAKKGELPEFDEKTGMMKSQGYDITHLGRLILRSIDWVTSGLD